MLYKVQFTHLVENIYEVNVDANSKKEALQKVEDDAFEYVVDEPISEDGLEIKDIHIIDN